MSDYSELVKTFLFTDRVRQVLGVPLLVTQDESIPARYLPSQLDPSPPEEDQTMDPPPDGATVQAGRNPPSLHEGPELPP